MVEQEKQEVALRESIEGFEKTKLHRANTVEKNPLPDAESMLVVLFVLFVTFVYYFNILAVIVDIFYFSYFNYLILSFNLCVCVCVGMSHTCACLSAFVIVQYTG